jgi:hypothetical protein
MPVYTVPDVPGCYNVLLNRREKGFMQDPSKLILRERWNQKAPLDTRRTRKASSLEPELELRDYPTHEVRLALPVIPCAIVSGPR